LYAIARCGDKQNTREKELSHIANRAINFPVFHPLMHHGPMSSAERTQWICEQARGAGFDLCGVAPVGDAGALFPELRHLPEWLARGYAGEMRYLHDPRRADPCSVMEGARSLIVVAINYNSEPLSSAALQQNLADGESPRGWISRYAWGDDYHEVLQQKLQSLIAAMRERFAGPFTARAYTDTGPIVERVAAKYAGLGWLGKNTCLINSQLGSWLFLGVVVTSLDLAPTLAPPQPPPADLCGTCTRCLDACPTQAFAEPYVLDARRCISYLTIELRGAIPEDLRAQTGRALIGCDICQDVCPWNRKAPLTPLAAFQPREMSDIGKSLRMPEIEWLASLSQPEFSVLFRGSAVKRAKWRGLVRNACLALGNSALPAGQPGHARALRLLERLAASEDSVISELARWALGRLSGSETTGTSVGLEKSTLWGETNSKTQ
jgi:epoxyqueuosine reductase